MAFLDIYFEELAEYLMSEPEALPLLKKFPMLALIVSYYRIDFVTGSYSVTNAESLKLLLRKVKVNSDQQESRTETYTLRQQSYQCKVVQPLDILYGEIYQILAPQYTKLAKSPDVDLFRLESKNLSPIKLKRWLERFNHDTLQENLLHESSLNADQREQVAQLIEWLNNFISTNFIVTAKPKNKLTEFVISEALLGSLARVLMGSISDACYLRSKLPQHIDSYIFRVNKSLRGGFLVIRSTSKSGENHAIIRALNPTETFANGHDMYHLLEILNKFVANNYPNHQIGIIYETFAGESLTNRPLIAEQFRNFQIDLPRKRIRGLNKRSTTFNNYFITEKVIPMDLILEAMSEG